MANSYSEILYATKEIEKEYYDVINQLSGKSSIENKKLKKETKKEIKRLKDNIKYYQYLVDKCTTFKRNDFLNFLNNYLALFENDLFTNKKFEINKSGKDTDNLNGTGIIDTDFMHGMSTWTLGITTGNPGLQLMGINELSNSSSNRNLVISNKVHLADGIKIKEKYKRYPLFQSVFVRLINLALEDPSLSPSARLDKVLEEEKVRRLTGRHM